jgi:hypothetical protein
LALADAKPAKTLNSESSIKHPKEPVFPLKSKKLENA